MNIAYQVYVGIRKRSPGFREVYAGDSNRSHRHSYLTEFDRSMQSALEENSHCVKMNQCVLGDAIVASQVIRFPTGLNLLNVSKPIGFSVKFKCESDGWRSSAD